MAFQVKVPAVGESVQEGMVHKWHRNTGDWVERDQVLLELETDKATVEIVAEVSGVVQQLKKAGDVVKVGEVIAAIDDAAAKPAGSAAPAKAPSKESNVTPIADAVSSKTNSSSSNRPTTPPPAPTNTPTMPLSPAVQRIVAENNLQASAIASSGKDGRLTKGDVIKHLDNVKTAPPPETKTYSTATPVPGTSSSTGQRGQRRESMSMLRRRIAERLLEAQRTNAILTTFNEVDMTQVMELRKLYKDKFKERHGVNLGFMSFFVKATVEALKTSPLVNGHIEGNEVVYCDYYDIGVAVSTERGLMVPVIRDVDRMNFAEIEKAIVHYGQKGREGKISIEDLTGGTFTISNGGVFGSLVSTPIINPPQSAILGMHKIQERPVVMNGNIVARPMMYLALSYDHRIIDGKEAVSFLVKIKECIEDPSRLILGV